MRKTNDLGRAALVTAIALCFAAPAFAQSSGPQTDATGKSAGSHPATGTTLAPSSGPQTDATSKSVGNHPATSNTPSAAGNANNATTATTMDPWASKYATDHQGRISRQAYMDEMGRRFDTMDNAKRGDLTRPAFLDDLGRQWEALDRGNQGLTPVEVNRINGKVPTFTGGGTAGSSDKASAPK